jgi:hypothetical protein
MKVGLNLGRIGDGKKEESNSLLNLAKFESLRLEGDII